MLKFIHIIPFLFLISCSHLSDTKVFRSRIPSSDDCNVIIKDFIKNPTLEISAGSLFGKNPEILEKMKGLYLDTADYALFYKNFVNKNKRSPTLQDIFVYASGQKLGTLKRYEELIGDLKNHPGADSPEILIFSRELNASMKKLRQYKSIEQINSEVVASYNHGKTNIPNLYVRVPHDQDNPELIDEEYYQFLKNRINVSGFQGEYGELLALGSTSEKAIARGLRFDPEFPKGDIEYEKIILEKVLEFEKNLKAMNDQEILALVELHKDGLFRGAREILEEDQLKMKRRDLVIEKIARMIKSKEIDLVTSDKNGNIVWSEVKAYIKPINMKAIGGNGKEKTVLDQLREHKALRDVLGLEDHVRLRFIAPLTNVSDKAIEAISALGYEVISAK